MFQHLTDPATMRYIKATFISVSVGVGVCDAHVFECLFMRAYSAASFATLATLCLIALWMTWV